MNPIKQLRLNANLTQAELAHQSNLSPGAVVKFELGLFSHLSHALLAPLNQPDSQASFNELQLAQSVWQDYHRKESAFMFWGLKPISYRPVGESSPYPHPLSLFIISVADHNNSPPISLYEFCTLLCLNPTIMSSFESGITRSVPSSLIHALNVAECPATCREALIVASASHASTGGSFND